MNAPYSNIGSIHFIHDMIGGYICIIQLCLSKIWCSVTTSADDVTAAAVTAAPPTPWRGRWMLGGERGYSDNEPPPAPPR